MVKIYHTMPRYATKWKEHTTWKVSCFIVNLAYLNIKLHSLEFWAMIKILFVCHGTTLIGWDLPRETTINHDLYWNYYQFTTFLSSDMNLLQQKTVLKEANNAFFGTAFCLSAVSAKTCFRHTNKLQGFFFFRKTFTVWSTNSHTGGSSHLSYRIHRYRAWCQFLKGM